MLDYETYKGFLEEEEPVVVTEWVPGEEFVVWWDPQVNRVEGLPNTAPFFMPPALTKDVLQTLWEPYAFVGTIPYNADREPVFWKMFPKRATAYNKSVFTSLSEFHELGLQTPEILYSGVYKDKIVKVLLADLQIKAALVVEPEYPRHIKEHGYLRLLLMKKENDAQE